MNSFFEKNMEALRGRNEQIREALLELKNGTRLRDDKTVEAYDVGGRTVLCVRCASGEMYQLGSMYSDELVMGLWEKLVDLANVGYMSKMVFFGIGNGSILRKVFSLKNDTLRVMAYEPSLTMFYDIISLCDISDLLKDPRLLLCVENIPFVAKERLYEFIDFRDLKRLHYQPYPNYRMLFKQEQKEFVDIAQVAYNAIYATQDVMARYGKAFYHNAMYNVSHFVHTRSIFDLYRKMPKEIPCILVASGPSLDKNIAYLKGLQGKAFMIAADSAVRVLLKHDIVPDMFVSIDASKNQMHFDDSRVADIPLLTEMSCNYRTMDHVKAPIFFYNDLNAYINAFLTEHNILLPYFNSGGSVVHSAYAMFASMGFQTVILVGQDLAYTDNKTHSQESVRGELHTDTEALDGFMTEGYYGGKVKTSNEFQLYKEWFEEKIEGYPDTHTINATEGGALIKGAENMPLSEAVSRFCTKEYDVQGIISGCGELFDRQTQRELVFYMQAAPEELKRIEEKAKKAVRDYDKILKLAYENKLGGGEMKRLLRQTGEACDLIEKAPVMYFIQNCMQETTQKFLEQVYEAKENVRAEVIDTAKLGKENLEAILRTIEECLPEMEEWGKGLDWLLE